MNGSDLVSCEMFIFSPVLSERFVPFNYYICFRR
jgi:hypothetical protein